MRSAINMGASLLSALCRRQTALWIIFIVLNDKNMLPPARRTTAARGYGLAEGSFSNQPNSCHLKQRCDFTAKPL
jgi:hypothetical protein